MRLTRSLRERSLTPSIAQQTALYARVVRDGDVSNCQLEQFNRHWQSIVESVPYYQELKCRERLPEQFRDWRQFSEMVPPLGRQVVKQRLDAFIRSERMPDQWRSTGGSTAEPLQVPIWNSECSVASHDLWLARSWFDVSPADKLFLVWGHSHLLGTGVRGRWNGLKRRAWDALLGYKRWSAYDLSDERLREAGNSLLKFRPAYLLGYSVALDRLAQVNHDRAGDFKRLNLKVVIATAESFPQPDSSQMIGDIFGCPVAMEYGAVETGPIAHQRPDGTYSVFWGSYYVEALPYDDVPERYEILVTSLFPRCVPLIRYRLGDLIEPDPQSPDVAIGFRTVAGRCNDTLQLASGTHVHSEAFSHALKESPIDGFQIVQQSDWEISLRYTAASALDATKVEEIRGRLGKISPELRTLEMHRVNSLEKTIAGKTRRIIDARCDAKVGQVCNLSTDPGSG